MSKYFWKGLFLILISFLVSINVYALDNNPFTKTSYDSIDMVLTTEDYSYLPFKAKEYIKDVYNKTGEIILTEKNKKENTPYLNPNFVKYLTLSEEEKETFEVTPEPYVLDYTNFTETKSRSVLPSTYDLRNVNGNSYVTPIKDQGSLGICWAMTTTELAESYLMIKNNKPYNSSTTEVFSPRQIDYATSTNGIANYTNENGWREELGIGGTMHQFSTTAGNGIALVPESIVPMDYGYNQRELYEILNYGNSSYEVNSTIILPQLSSGATTNQFNSYIEQMKSYIIEYGGAYVGTGSPGGSCSSKNVDGFVLAVNSDCYNNPDFGAHAMQIIGWDDDYEYKYCLSGTTHLGVNTSGTCSTGILKTGTGAWLLRNPWGISISYLYLSYDSIYSSSNDKVSIGFITSLSSMNTRSWDNNYHNMPWAYNYNFSANDTATFTKKISGNEKLTQIKFLNASQNSKFNISVNGSFVTSTDTIAEPGLVTVDLSGYDINLNSDTFTVKVASTNSTSLYTNTISVFTSNVSRTPVVKTSNMSMDLTSDIHKVYTLYSDTKNIPSNERVTYKVYKDGEDVTNHFNVVNNIVAINNINAYINVVDYVQSGQYTLVSEYNGVTNTSTLNIASRTGPVTVTKPDDTEEILQMGDSYTLGTNNMPKESEDKATVTFVFRDGEVTPDETRNVIKSYTPNGWLVNNVHRSNNEVLILGEDITIRYDYIDALISPVFPEPTRSGYIFAGWYTKKTGGDKVTEYTGDEDITLYAHWIRGVKVTLPDDTEETYNYGDTYNLGTNDVPKANENGAEILFNYMDGRTSTTNVIKNFTPNGWLINGVETNNNEVLTLTEDITIRYNYSETKISPTFPSPTRDSYTFAGWYTEDIGGTKVTEYTGTEDIILYAHWIGDHITVRLPDNTTETYNYGDTYALGINNTSKSNEDISLVTFKYEYGNLSDSYGYVQKSYTPNGWLVNNEPKLNNEILLLTQHIIIKYNYTEALVSPEFPAPTREHYTFDGWFDENNNKITSYIGNENIVLHAKWTGVPIRITKGDGTVEIGNYGDTYDLGVNNIPKSNVNASTVTLKYGYNVPDDYEYVQKSYTPNGWIVGSELKEDNETITLTKDIEIYPVYTMNLVPVILDTPSREGYRFEGWYTEENGGTKVTSYSSTQNVTLYAHWSCITPTGINVDKEKIVLNEGNTHQIIPTILPSGALDNVVYSDYDSNVVTVTDSGLITAVALGTTSIKVALESNPTKYKIINVIVTELDTELTSSLLDVKERTLDGIDYRIIVGEEPNTPFEDFLAKLDNERATLKVFDKNGEEIENITDEVYTATGMVVKLVINDNVLDEAIVIVRGDINEDGLVEAQDKAAMKNHLLGKDLFIIDDYRAIAADLVEDPEAVTIETIVNAEDNVRLANYLLGKQNSELNPHD